jgi:hypothetical protein
MRVVSVLMARRMARLTLPIPVNLEPKDAPSFPGECVNPDSVKSLDRLYFLSSTYPSRKILATGLPLSCFALEKALDRFLLFQKKSINSADSENAFLIYRCFVIMIAHDVAEKKSSNKSTN